MDYQIKFWGPVFETFFSSPSVVLHWGDSISKPCLKKNLRFKVDLRLLVFNNEEVIVDGLNGEVAKQATKRKLYGDRLKSVLATKCHINNFLATMPFLSVATVKTIIFPIIQIMGLNVHVLTLRLGNKGIYVLQEVASFRFPTTVNNIKDNMKELINGSALIETLVDNLKVKYGTSHEADEDEIERVLKGAMKMNKFNSSSWVSEVVYSHEDDADNEDDDGEGEKAEEEEEVGGEEGDDYKSR